MNTVEQSLPSMLVQFISSPEDKDWANTVKVQNWTLSSLAEDRWNTRDWCFNCSRMPGQAGVCPGAWQSKQGPLQGFFFPVHFLQSIETAMDYVQDPWFTKGHSQFINPVKTIFLNAKCTVTWCNCTQSIQTDTDLKKLCPVYFKEYWVCSNVLFLCPMNDSYRRKCIK